MPREDYDDPARQKRRDVAADTLAALETGRCPDVSAQSVVWPAEDPVPLVRPVPVGAAPTHLLVEAGTTTLCAAEAWARRDPTLGVLNFASARNPGGGFYNGANAQEESLVRSSGLYPCLNRFEQEMYAPHWANPSGTYTHCMIESPGVTVFKDDEGAEVPPYTVLFVSSPAPNTSVLTRKRGASSRSASFVNGVLKERIRRVLTIFHNAGCRTIVLGAWGCGVFGNDPNVVADIFAQELARFAFERVVFAIIDPAMAEAFRGVMEGWTRRRTAE